ncbi:cupin domain-containing protein [Ignavigranum ruoffiae]|uniref:Ethanolamine utilization protein EutQ n=1 Tax=Ignavigranum ruoffiae TaxID=89093 RepID=A0A1H9CE62_9LACT|nr:cupin domain-containing protein [Ignavigranum ruoffiae]SEP99449.1 ethanolamine utilization protein EutQ [Ignavigranum ruoffiae]
MSIDKDKLELMVREVLKEMLVKESDTHGVKKIELPNLSVREEDRMDTGNPNDIVYTRDLFTLDESPRLGCGLMEMEHTTFDWTLTYDEIDYIIEGELSININGNTITAGPGEIILIPKGSSIQFSVKNKARFLYIVYPANWQNV